MIDRFVYRKDEDLVVVFFSDGRVSNFPLSMLSAEMRNNLMVFIETVIGIISQETDNNEENPSN